MIRVEKLTKTFTRNQIGFDAVNDVTFKLEKGSFAALTGPSGSGKTTLLNMIAGMIRPTSGQIFINENDLMSMTPKQLAQIRSKKMGYILQGQSLLGNFTILDNVCMPAYLSSQKQNCKGRAMELLNMIGLENLAKEYPKTLSGGEMRRVAIIRAMINTPDIILADEPTSNLDPENAHKIMQLLKDISQSGTTVLLTTHELEYLSYVDHVLRMEKGTLV